MILLAAALALATAGPPPASLDAGGGRTNLVVSSWCWAGKCGAPIAASTHTATAQRGAVVRIDLTFAPRSARVAIAGRTVPVTVDGRELSWRAARGGGLSVRVTSPRGWVVYVGRLRLR